VLVLLPVLRCPLPGLLLLLGLLWFGWLGVRFLCPSVPVWLAVLRPPLLSLLVEWCSRLGVRWVLGLLWPWLVWCLAVALFGSFLLCPRLFVAWRVPGCRLGSVGCRAFALCLRSFRSVSSLCFLMPCRGLKIRQKGSFQC
jgi:hypothetical protein